MKKVFKSLLLCCLAVLPVLFSGCNPINKNYGVSSEQSAAESKPQVSYPKHVKIPTIKSTDTVMPIYFDISLYDEENYAEIYLGKKYQFKASYAGSDLNVPTTLKELNKSGWEIAEDEHFDLESSLQAGSVTEIRLINRENMMMTAFFHNGSNKSDRLIDCKIIRLAVDENKEVTGSANYGTFNINGVENTSAVTDVFQALGAPSHFHADSKTDYTLNWFKTKEDRRNKITVKINTEKDCVTYIAISNYK